MDKNAPLLAVIENSDERRANGQQPVMTVLRPMTRLEALAYRWLFRPAETRPVDPPVAAQGFEYVVELDGGLFELLASGRTTGARRARGDRIRLILTPSAESKAAHAVALDGDPIP